MPRRAPRRATRGATPDRHPPPVPALMWRDAAAKGMIRQDFSATAEFDGIAERNRRRGSGCKACAFGVAGEFDLTQLALSDDRHVPDRAGSERILKPHTAIKWRAPTPRDPPSPHVLPQHRTCIEIRSRPSWSGTGTLDQPAARRNISLHKRCLNTNRYKKGFVKCSGNENARRVTGGRHRHTSWHKAQP